MHAVYSFISVNAYRHLRATCLLSRHTAILRASICAAISVGFVAVCIRSTSWHEVLKTMTPLVAMS